MRAHSVVSLAEHFLPKGHSLAEYSTHTASYNLLRVPEVVPFSIPSLARRLSQARLDTQGKAEQS